MVSVPMSVSSSRDSISLRPSAQPFQPGISKVWPHQPDSIALDKSNALLAPLMRMMPSMYADTNLNAVPLSSYRTRKSLSPVAIFPPTPMSQLSLSPIGSTLTSPMGVSPLTSPVELLSSGYMSRTPSGSQRGGFLQGDYMTKGRGGASRRSGSPIQPFQMKHHNSKPSISINAAAFSNTLASQKPKRKAIVRLPELDFDSDDSIDIITEEEDTRVDHHASTLRQGKVRCRWPNPCLCDLAERDFREECTPFPFDCLQSYEELRDLNAPLDGLPDYIDICLPIEDGWEELRSLFQQKRLQQREEQAKLVAPMSATEAEETQPMMDDKLIDTQSSALGLSQLSMPIDVRDTSWKELGRGFGYNVAEEAADAEADGRKRVHSNKSSNSGQNEYSKQTREGASYHPQHRDGGERDEDEDEKDTPRKKLVDGDGSEGANSEYETSDDESGNEEYTNPSDEEDARRSKAQRRAGNHSGIAREDGGTSTRSHHPQDHQDEMEMPRRYSLAARGPLDNPAPMMPRSTSLQSARSSSRLDPDAPSFAPRGLLSSFFGTDSSINSRANDRNGILSATAPSFTPGPAALAALSKAAKMPASPVTTLMSSQNGAKDMQGREKRQRMATDTINADEEGEADISQLQSVTKELSSSSLSDQISLKPTAPPFYPTKEAVASHVRTEKPVFKLGGDDSRDASPMILSRSLPQTQARSRTGSESVGTSALPLSRSLSNRSPESRRNNLVSSILHSARSSMSSIRRDASLGRTQQRRRSSGMELDKFSKLAVKEVDSDDGSVSDIIEEIGERVDMALEGWASRILDEMLIINQVRPASMVTLDPTEKQSIVEMIREGVQSALLSQMADSRDVVAQEGKVAAPTLNLIDDTASMLSSLTRHHVELKDMMQKLSVEHGERQGLLDKLPDMLGAKVDLLMAVSKETKDANRSIVDRIDRMQASASAQAEGGPVDSNLVARLEDECKELKRRLEQAKSDLDREEVHSIASSKEAEAMRQQREQRGSRIAETESEMIMLKDKLSQALRNEQEIREQARSLEQEATEAQARSRELQMALRNDEEQKQFLRERLDELTREVSDDREMRRREKESAAQALEEAIQCRRENEQALKEERQRVLQYQQLDKEGRRNIEMHLERAAKAEGQVSALEKRLSEQDVKITNLQQLTATQKQKAAQTGQRLAEVEKRAKDAVDLEKELVASRARMSELEGRLRTQDVLEQRLLSSQESEARLREDLTTTQARFLENERELSLTKENKVDRGLLDELKVKLCSSLEEASALRSQLEEAQRKNVEMKSTTSSPAKRIIRLKRQSQGGRSTRQEQSFAESAMHGSSTWASAHTAGSSTDEMDPTRRPISPADDSYESVNIGNSRSISCLSTSRIVEVDDEGWWS